MNNPKLFPWYRVLPTDTLAFEGVTLKEIRIGDLILTSRWARRVTRVEEIKPNLKGSFVCELPRCVKNYEHPSQYSTGSPNPEYQAYTEGS